MGIKRIDCVEIKPCNSKPFPKIMKSRVTGTIALVLDCGRGTILVKGNEAARAVGLYGDINVENYDDYNEPLTLQNE
jgi:hypothetical protein